MAADAVPAQPGVLIKTRHGGPAGASCPASAEFLLL